MTEQLVLTLSLPYYELAKQLGVTVSHPFYEPAQRAFFIDIDCEHSSNRWTAGRVLR